MTLHVNGEPREFPDGLSVAALVAELGMKPDRVAVELNLEIVPRAQWERTTLKSGDKLEVVHFVGGGSTTGEAPSRQLQPTVTPKNKSRVCPTCGAGVEDKFCGSCGEKEFERHDLSFAHFFSHALGEFLHFDSKIFRSFRLLLTRPGFLTGEYLRGCRKLYLHPFQLFFVANLIYFVLQPYTGWTGLRTTLAIQMQGMSYSGLASRMVATRIATKHVPLDTFARSFDHAVDLQARTLVVVMVPIFAVFLSLLEWRKRRFFGEHLVFSLHFTACWLITVFILIPGGATLLLALLGQVGIKFNGVNWDAGLFPIQVVSLAIYTVLALRCVYGDPLIAAILKGAALALSLYYVLEAYRFILFLTAFYTS